MSLNSQIKSLFHETISSGSLSLLDKRKEILNKRVERGPDDIIYLTSNTAWIRVTSAVDVVDEGGPEYAKKYQLFKGISSADRGFVPIEDPEKSSYTESIEYGYVPIAGITNLDIQSMNDTGTLKIASITFVVNSPEDFNNIEKIYLRPGFGILVEWGHSIKVNPDGTVDSNIEYYDTDTFLKPQDSKSIKKEIDRLRISNNFNYDGFYGKVRNFSWEYNGINFICNLEIIAVGDVINTLTNNTISLPSGEEEVKYSASNFTTDIIKILNLIKTSPVENFFTSNSSANPIEDATRKVKQILSEKAGKYKSAFDDLTMLVGNLASQGISRESNWTKYITLRDFLRLINQSNLIYDQEGKNLLEFKINNGVTYPFTTFPSHVGLDPGVCILPKTSKTSVFTIPFAQQITTLDENDLLNVFISVDFIINKYTEFSSSQDEAGDSVFKVLNSILKTLEKNLGYINNFDIAFEENEDLYYIVDKTVVLSNTDFNSNGVIDLIGLKSEIDNFQIQSVINDDFANKITFSSTADRDLADFENISGLHAWNRGLINRHTQVVTTGTDRDNGDVETVSIDELKQRYINFLRSRSNNNSYYLAYSQKDFDGLRYVHMRLMRKLLADETQSRTTNYPGILPLILTFTIKGVSGIKLLQTFKINDFFLPDNYRSRTAFKILGLDHSISEGKWVTSIRAYLTSI